MDFWTRLFAALLIAVNLSGCSTGGLSRPDASSYKRTYSYSIPQTTKTTLGQAIAGDLARHKKQSGLHLLANGTESLDMRLALVRSADKTLDLQYYAMHDDTTSNLMLEAILRAASRGVRVRFLIDNIGFKDVGDSLVALDNNKQIEIRVFNPMFTRDQPIVTRLTGFITDLGQATKRMHNKLLISDNQMAILGGRNLGDEYFDADRDVNFKDTDILVAGPVVDQVSKSFDKYWNSDESFPITVLRKPSYEAQKLEALKEALRYNWEKKRKTPEGNKMLDVKFADHLQKGELPFIWAPVELAADDPVKIAKPDGQVESKPLIRLGDMVDHAKHEFVIISPYFVPQDDGVKWLSGLVKRGIKVRVLTNSLASTDVVAVHTGYRRTRKALVEQGVELYELKPIDNKRPKQRLAGTSAPAHASLHSKVYVIDRKDVLIGSFNLDPRSIELNTELALVVHSPALADQVIKLFESSIAPEASYHLTETDRGNLVWQAKEKGKKVEYHHEPKAGTWRNIELFFMSLLPVENQL